MVCVANVNGEFAALNNICGHRGGPLGAGVVLDGKIVCPLHGWMFNPKTGVADDDPHFPVAVYRLRIEGEDVFVDV
jgi:nitrite reductase/ring-hydroxylating ferredoxin subunit